MARDVIAMSGLGGQGRFANQMVQYMFLKTYAWRHDLEVQTPPWIGQELYGFDDPPIATPLPEFVEPYDKDPERMVIPQLDEPLRNVDVSGYFQYHTSYYRPFRDRIRELFTPVETIKQPLDRAAARLRDMGKTVVAIHMRLGDYGYDCFYLTPTSWYLRWLETVWESLDEPVLFLASDEPRKVVDDFREYRPVTAADLGAELPRAPYFPDFYLLSQADHLAIPNSTFSFVAAMLAADLRSAHRSDLRDPLGDPPFRAFDPWDDFPLDWNVDAADFPHVPGLIRPRKYRPFSRRWFRRSLARLRS